MRKAQGAGETDPGPPSALPVYLAVILVSYTATAGITTVYSMLKLLYASFDEPLRIGWVVTAYWLVASICAAIGGRIGDAIGRRRMAVFMLAIAGVGSLLSALSSSLVMVILGCALQGTTGTLTPLTIGIVRESIAHEKVPFAVGVIAAAGNVCTGISFMAAGYIVDHYSWQGGFFMKAVLVTLAIAALLILVPARRPAAAPLPSAGMLSGLLFAPAIAGIFITFQLAHVWGWQDPRVGVVLAASAALLTFWGWQQARQTNPLIDVKSLAKREILVANASVALLAVGCMQNGQIMSLFLQQPQWTRAGFGLSATQAGVLLMGINALALIASPWSGAITARKGPRTAGVAGALMVLTGWATITLSHQSFALVIAADALLMLGLSFLQPAAYNTVVAATPPDRTSEATGLTYVFLNTFIAVGGQIVFLLLATPTVSAPGRAGGGFPGDPGYTLAFGYVAAIALLGLLVATRLPGRRADQAIETGPAAATAQMR